ncbi:hypothetical protein DFH07DRAFT_766796 [Mycena maculata]|uniref:Uncharacterized protein n=1 Tax=Mycena maculata TaxID=230809 RepID=A0AAD7K3Y3_9AGAR|nr:hypothetical protein DFH07DRAFT_766796 [Mycena maculata]
MPLQVPYDIWAYSSNNTVVIASNTRQIPDLPKWNHTLVDSPLPRVDGRWGFDEYSRIPQIYDSTAPYLAWLPLGPLRQAELPSQINVFSLNPTSAAFVRNPGWPHRGYLDTALRENFQKDVVWYIDRLRSLIAAEEAKVDSIHEDLGIKPPVIAMVRSHNACFSLRFPHLTYRDVVEYFAALQRSLAELQAYIMWHDRMEYAELPTVFSGSETGLRGAIVATLADYTHLRRLGAPVWWEFGMSDAPNLDGTKQGVMTPLAIECQPWAAEGIPPALRDTHKGKLIHNKPLEYYPPHVNNKDTFERAARGYSERLDNYNEDKHCVADVRKMMENTTDPISAKDLTGNNHNRSEKLAAEVRRAGGDAADLMEKYAADRAILPGPDVPTRSSGPKAAAPSSKWYRQHQDISRIYKQTSWVPTLVDAWEMGFQNTTYPMVHNIQLIPKCKELLLFLAPPPHLFMNTTEEKCRNMLFVWTCIRKPWLGRVDRDVGCREVVSWGLTTQQWREILGGTYWKFKHPRTPTSEFSWRKFWKYGGALIFGEEQAEWDLMELSPKVITSMTGRLEPEHFSDDQLKALLMWDLTLCHAQVQLDRADEVLYAQRLATDGIILDRRRARRIGLFHEANWTIPTRTLPPWERDYSERPRRHWLARFVEVIIEWPCASQMQWFFEENKLRDISAQEGQTQLAAFCERLSDGKIRMLEVSVVAVYYQGIFDALGILAIGVFKRPKISALAAFREI